MATQTTVGGIASAMGPAVEKLSKVHALAARTGDDKKHMRESTLNALDAWIAAVQLDKMVPYITVALVDPKLGAERKKDLFDWLSKHLSGNDDLPDALHLLKATAAAFTRGAPTKASKSESVFSVQDLAVQSQALFNVKDSNKDEMVKCSPHARAIRDVEDEELRRFFCGIFQSQEVVQLAW